MDSLKIFLDKDINTELIKTKKIAVIGFGSQGYGQVQPQQQAQPNVNKQEQNMG